MAKRSFLLAAALAAFVVSAWSETPKIAVLDVTIPKGFDSSVIIPVTESIMEQLVASRKYTVLDRANIEAIFKERDFQLSGEVSNDQVTQAGKFLGASYVVVSKIQLVGSSYFLSAKMIDTETAAITTQASDSQKGDASVVIAMAQTVGAKIAGITVATTSPTAKPGPSPKPSPRPEPSAEPAPSPQPLPATPQKAPVFRIVADLSLPSWVASNSSGILSIGKEINNSDTLLKNNQLAFSPTTVTLGFEAYAHLNIGDWFYLAAEYDFFNTSLKDSKFPSSTKFYTDMSLENIMGGLGLSIPLDYWGQIYGGALVGAGTFRIGDLWSGAVGFTLPSKLSQTGLAFAVEVGGSIFILHYLTVDVRYRYGGATFFNLTSGNPINWYTSPRVGIPLLEYSTVAFGVGLSL
jgi:TolB-like protein